MSDKDSEKMSKESTTTFLIVSWKRFGPSFHPRRVRLQQKLLLTIHDAVEQDQSTLSQLVDSSWRVASYNIGDTKNVNIQEYLVEQPKKILQLPWYLHDIKVELKLTKIDRYPTVTSIKVEMKNMLTGEFVINTNISDCSRFGDRCYELGSLLVSFREKDPKSLVYTSDLKTASLSVNGIHQTVERHRTSLLGFGSTTFRESLTVRLCHTLRNDGPVSISHSLGLQATSGLWIAACRMWSDRLIANTVKVTLLPELLKTIIYNLEPYIIFLVDPALVATEPLKNIDLAIMLRNRFDKLKELATRNLFQSEDLMTRDTNTFLADKTNWSGRLGLLLVTNRSFYLKLVENGITYAKTNSNPLSVSSEEQLQKLYKRDWSLPEWMSPILQVILEEHLREPRTFCLSQPDNKIKPEPNAQEWILTGRYYCLDKRTYLIGPRIVDRLHQPNKIHKMLSGYGDGTFGNCAELMNLTHGDNEYMGLQIGGAVYYCDRSALDTDIHKKNLQLGKSKAFHRLAYPDEKQCGKYNVRKTKLSTRLVCYLVQDQNQQAFKFYLAVKHLADPKSQHTEIPLEFGEEFSDCLSPVKTSLRLFSEGAVEEMAAALVCWSNSTDVFTSQILLLALVRWNVKTQAVLSTITKGFRIDIGALLQESGRGCSASMAGKKSQISIFKKYKRVFVMVETRIQQIAYLVYCQHGNEFLPIGGGHPAHPGLYLMDALWKRVESHPQHRGSDKLWYTERQSRLLICKLIVDF